MLRLLFFLAAMSSTFLHAGEITVAAAADLSFCLPEIDNAFRKAHPGAVVNVSFGSSGNIATQLRNGAPFDVFLSADTAYPRELAKESFADAASITTYAHGQIVLWTGNDKIDLSRGLAVLNTPEVKRFAIANPDHAPYGRAARAVLRHAGLWDLLQPKVITGENVSQAAEFVQTGNADAGIVALSLLRAPKMNKQGHYYLIPPEDYPPIEQAAALTKSGSANALAREYLDFLKTPDAKKILVRFGFQLP